MEVGGVVGRVENEEGGSGNGYNYVKWEKTELKIINKKRKHIYSASQFPSNQWMTK